MKMSLIKTYHKGDEIWWEDPDNGECSRYFKIKNISVKGNVVSIDAEDGDCIEGFAREFHASKPPRKFYRSVVTVEILSEEPFAFDDSDGNGVSCPKLDAISTAITSGDCSGAVDVKVHNQAVSGKQMAKLLEKQGSDPGFFRLTEDGKDLEE